MIPSRKSTWEEKIRRSGFFVGAMLFHVVLFLLVATYVVIQVPPKEPDPKFGRAPLPIPVTPTDPPKTPTTSQFDPSAAALTIIHTDGPGEGQLPVAPGQGKEWTAPVPNGETEIKVGDLPPQMTKPVRTTGPNISDKRKDAIEHFEEAHRDRADIAGHDPRGKYPVFVAAYADGDWNCNIVLNEKGEIAAGSMPNLTAKIQEWTHGDVEAKVVAKPLDIGSSELLDKCPPFIFFTGHKDFKLTEKEVRNLQAYVEEGGAIWGDNALPGKGSRFDVAFKREMKRVVPDKDCQFEPVASDADVFVKQKYQITQLPEGMNYYTEQIEHLDIDGVPAIVYTPNDYSDLYSMRILPGDKEIMGPSLPRGWKGLPLTTNGTFLYNQGLFFRNFTLPSAIAVHRLGLNMVTYLITRFDDYLLLSPP